jgi:hypothetical protein
MARWQVTLLRKKGQTLGVIEAPDERSAILEAAKLYEIEPELRFKIAVTLVEAKKDAKRERPSFSPQGDHQKHD